MRWNKIIILFLIVGLVSCAAVAAVMPVIPGVSWLPFTHQIKQGLDLQGGVHVVLEAKPNSPDEPLTDDAIRRAVAIIENRVNAYGIAEPIVQRQGAHRIIVELAGVTDPDEAVRNMIRPAYLEFQDMEGNTLLTGEHLKNAYESKNQAGIAQVNLEFDSEGARLFAEITAANLHKPLAIVIDGEQIQAPMVNSVITGGNAEISPYSSLEDAHNMAILLRSGALPTKLEVEEKRVVGPTLGADTLEKSVRAGIIGLIAIVVFMILYYRLPGIIAAFALVTYAVIVLFIFAGINVTMTLPGVCGFLLSLGMAIDANILIFERLKEELWSGKTLGPAISAGFKRAFVTILDANITTLLVAGVLYYFGSGPIKGFAVTLSIGVLASMFTAIVFTRQLLLLVADSRLVRNLKMYGA
ncbi:MAG: protein translocase subunit SecD [Peptococcaceae bacterium]|nr:protein translocase subunit SecD [Peptococcaceae bacterium]